MKSDLWVPVPLSKCAFDDTATLRTWQRVWRWALTDLLLRVAVWLALLIVATQVETASQLTEGLASFLLIPGAILLRGPARRVIWLRTVRTALMSAPWRHCTAVRTPDVQTRTGVAVRVALDGDEGAPAVLVARTWRSRTRWPEDFGQAAWFAGHPERGGVIARPGGEAIMTLHHR
ncbi:hypothetical protein ACFQVC_04485 [Streptomyces monticola]|uniref:PH domain-containing protein n=1 Tax=Streptomyces monticola TaxID=2666263 RepID=A0ABW2JDY8_9ACTN